MNIIILILLMFLGVFIFCVIMDSLNIDIPVPRYGIDIPVVTKLK
jgi:hypothetical protein